MDTKQLIQAFVARVNARAEADMLAGGPITGAHHRAIEMEMAALSTSEDVPCIRCGTTTSADGDWYRVCGPCRLQAEDELDDLKGDLEACEKGYIEAVEMLVAERAKLVEVNNILTTASKAAGTKLSKLVIKELREAIAEVKAEPQLLTDELKHLLTDELKRQRKED